MAVRNLTLGFILNLSNVETVKFSGSFFEFHEILPLLTRGQPPFHVVCPSLPGYGFSSPPRRGKENNPLTFSQMAIALDALMRGLGFNSYVSFLLPSLAPSRPYLL